MPSLPANLSPIRKSVAYLLRSDEHAGNLYNTIDIAYVLIIVADVDNNADIRIGVYLTLIARAFTFERKIEYTLSFSECFGYKSYRRVLYNRRTNREKPDSPLVTTIGCFCLLEAGQRVSDI